MPWLPHKSSPASLPIDPDEDQPPLRPRYAPVVDQMPWLMKRWEHGVRREREEDAPLERRRLLGPLVYSPFRAAARGVYRTFNAAEFRFYWSDSAPPVAGDTPQATNATLAYTTSATFADGTWYLSVSYFDGAIDSGFLPLGPLGETYLTLEISGGVALAERPSQPINAALNVLAGGVVQIVAIYFAAPDGTNRASQWAIAYTTDGTTPASDTPTLTPAMSAGPMQILTLSLPAQTGGTVVKVQLQAYSTENAIYSLPLDVLIATAETTGPTAPLGLQSWLGFVEGD
jgi:hypothetical protein